MMRAPRFLTPGIAAALLIVGCGSCGGTSAEGGGSGCSPGFSGQYSWGDCFPENVPVQTVRDAPFPLIDPRLPVLKHTGLTLNGIFVAYLGSDDLDRSHPKGPLMAANFSFGTPPPPGAT